MSLSVLLSLSSAPARELGLGTRYCRFRQDGRVCRGQHISGAPVAPTYFTCHGRSSSWAACWLFSWFTLSVLGAVYEARSAFDCFWVCARAGRNPHTQEDVARVRRSVAPRHLHPGRCATGLRWCCLVPGGRLTRAAALGCLSGSPAVARRPASQLTFNRGVGNAVRCRCCADQGTYGREQACCALWAVLPYLVFQRGLKASLKHIFF